MKVTNNTTSTIYIGNVKLPPMGSADVPNFEQVKKSGAIPAWLESDIISEGAAKKPKSKKAKAAVKSEAVVETEDEAPVVEAAFITDETEV